MQLYSARAAPRTRQVIGDVVALACLVVAGVLSGVVSSAVSSLSTYGAQLERAGDSFADAMTRASEALERVPLVGDGLGAPFRDARVAAEQLATAGRDEQEAVAGLATALGTATWLIPLFLVIALWIVPRARFVLRAREAVRTFSQPAGRDVLALRAIATQPFADVIRAVPDPLAAIRSGDDAALHALARLELAAAGVRAPRGG